MKKPHQIDLEELIAEVTNKQEEVKQEEGEPEIEVNISQGAMHVLNALGVSSEELIELVKDAVGEA